MAFLSVANQFLFFFAVLIVIGLMLKPVISSLFKADYAPPKIKVVDSTDSQESSIDVEYRIFFKEDIMDVFVFEISANAIETKKKGTVVNMFEYYGDKFETVNLLFAPKSGESYNLMENNAYIISASFYKSGENSYQKLSKNLYLIVSDDTNGDGFLSTKDSADLFMSDYNGKNMSVVLKGVETFDVIQDDLLLIEKKSEGKKLFYTFNVLTKKLFQLDTKIMLTSH